MYEFVTEVTIDAPRDHVWGILTDFGRYGEWNGYIPRIDGELAVGATLTVRASPPGATGRTFAPEVVKVDPPNEFRWVGTTKVPGLFRGEHIFRLEAIDEKSVRFVHLEQFSGAVEPLHKRFRLAATRRGFEQMNAGLKARAEAS